jgi:hypothetical protein
VTSTVCARSLAEKVGANTPPHLLATPNSMGVRVVKPQIGKVGDKLIAPTIASPYLAECPPRCQLPKNARVGSRTSLRSVRIIGRDSALKVEMSLERTLIAYGVASWQGVNDLGLIPAASPPQARESRERPSSFQPGSCAVR